MNKFKLRRNREGTLANTSTRGRIFPYRSEYFASIRTDKLEIRDIRTPKVFGNFDIRKLRLRKKSDFFSRYSSQKYRIFSNSDFFSNILVPKLGFIEVFRIYRIFLVFLEYLLFFPGVNIRKTSTSGQKTGEI